MRFPDDDPIAREILANARAKVHPSSERAAGYDEAISDVLSILERNLAKNDILHGARTPDEKFERLLRAATTEAGWTLTKELVRQQTGLDQGEALKRLDEVVQDGGLIHRDIVRCGRCGTTDSDPDSVDEFRDGYWNCHVGCDRDEAHLERAYVANVDAKGHIAEGSNLTADRDVSDAESPI